MATGWDWGPVLGFVHRTLILGMQMETMSYSKAVDPMNGLLPPSPILEFVKSRLGSLLLLA